MGIFTQAITTADVLTLNYVLTDYTWNAAGGNVTHYITKQGSQIKDTGKFYIKMQYTTLGNSDDCVTWYPMWQDGNNWYKISINDSANANEVECRVDEGGVNSALIVSGSANSGTAEHYYQLSRDGLGNWELKKDGVSIGTTNNDFLPTAVNSNIVFENSGGGSVVVVKEVKENAWY